MSEPPINDHVRPHTTAWLLVVLLAFVWLFPVLLVRGMSLDGVIYATVARNLSQGIGDPWHLVYTATEHKFRESPPLAFVFESWLFRLCGDQWWVERLYSISTIVPTAGVLVLIWRHLVARCANERSAARQALAWLPVALWVSMPAWPWIYRNNYLENTLGIFSALAVYGSLRAFDSRRWWPAWSALAAVAIGAAVLSKGPVGLFPAISPAVAWLALRPRRTGKALAVQLGLVVGLVLIAALLLAGETPRESLTEYFETQVLPSLQGQREIVRSPIGRFSLLWNLVVHDLWASMLVAGVCVVWARRRGIDTFDRQLRGPMWFCLLTALSASLPIMISPKQSAYYAAPSWPFFTMALALWCLPAVEGLVAQGAVRAGSGRVTWWLRTGALAVMGLLVALSPLWAGRQHRDQKLARDVELICQIVGPGATIAAPVAMKDEWSLEAYLYRLHYISIDITDERQAREYRLDFAHKTERPADEDSDAQPLDAGLELYRLYKSADVTAMNAGPRSDR